MSYAGCWLFLRGMIGTSRAQFVAVVGGYLIPTAHLQDNSNVKKAVAAETLLACLCDCEREAKQSKGSVGKGS